MNLAFAREKAEPRLFDEIGPLLQKHYSEIARFQDIPLDPDFNRYALMEQADLSRTFTARWNGELVGYAVFYVGPAIQYKSSIQATEDLMFLRPDLRQGRHGLDFLKWIDAALEAEGVDVIYHHVNTDHDYGPILKRMGYETVNVIYGKRVGKETALCVPE